MQATRGHTSENDTTHAGIALRAARAALSELFLDTELDESDLARIVQVLATTGLEADELERIFTDELEPVLASNLDVPAGEWRGFDVDWLEAQIRQRKAQGTLVKALGHGVRALSGASAASDDWHTLKAMLTINLTAK